MSWTLAPSLAQLFKELNAKYPHRDTTTDGTIGDQAHAARQSEHNPNHDPNDTVPDGMVTAIDIDKDGIDVPSLLATLIADSRTWYVIWDHNIYSRTYGFKKRAYTGASPHTDHVHISLVQTGVACKDTSPWFKTPVVETPYQRVKRIAAQRLRKIKNLKARLAK